MKLRLLIIISLVSIALLASFGVVLAQERSAQGVAANGGMAASDRGSGVSASPLAVVGSGFTYQGQLKSSNNPVNGTCDFQFSLYDAVSGGAQVGTTQTIPAVSVVNGVFTVVLNSSGEFGPTAFTGDERYLAIAVRCPAGSGSFTALTPRQTLSAAPYALSLKPEAVINGSSVTTTTGVLNIKNSVGGYCDNAAGVRATSGVGSTGFIFCDDTAIYGNGSLDGVLGTGDLFGVGGVSRSTYGWGLFARADGDNGTGLYINTGGEKSKGISVNTGGDKGTGIFVNSYGQESNAIYAINYSTAITTGFGIYSVKGSTSGYDLLEHYLYPGAVVGDTNVGNGVMGISSAPNGDGLIGIITGTASNGVVGWALSTNYGTGVFGISNATNGYGVYGESYSTDGTAGYFTNVSGSLNGWGVRAFTASGNSGDVHPGGWLYNAAGEFAGPNGLIGAASHDVSSGFGVTGISPAEYGRGVVGRASHTTGINYGVYAWTDSPNGYAGYFGGNVSVYGNFSASGTKAFRIDYPLDPANKYLLHYAVESPQVQNQYNGTVTLDANGEAVVDLPVYFSTVNTGPFQYQLTAIGAPGPNLYIAQEVAGNQFKIAGGAPGMKVSWLLFGLRNDPWMQDHPQTDVANKPAGEAGKYVYPQGYGQPATLQLGFLQQDNPLHLMQPVAPQLPQQNTGTPGTTNVPQRQQPNNVPGSSTYPPQP
jgi:hypothetical protein